MPTKCGLNLWTFHSKLFSHGVLCLATWFHIPYTPNGLGSNFLIASPLRISLLLSATLHMLGSLRSILNVISSGDLPLVFFEVPFLYLGYHCTTVSVYFCFCGICHMCSCITDLHVCLITPLNIGTDTNVPMKPSRLLVIQQEGIKKKTNN